MYAYLQSTAADGEFKDSSVLIVGLFHLFPRTSSRRCYRDGFGNRASTNSVIVTGPSASATHTDRKHALIGMRKASASLRAHHVRKKFHRHVYREGPFVATGDT